MFPPSESEKKPGRGPVALEGVALSAQHLDIALQKSLAFRAWNAWNGRVMSGLDSYGQLFQCYISTEISTNSGESNLPLHDSFFL